MSIKAEFLKTKLTAYLERRSMPRSLADKPSAQHAELAALLACVNRLAPRDGFEDWWAMMEISIAENANTYAWPTEGDIKKAAGKIRGPRKVTVSQGDELDPLKVMGERMEAGDAVGDGWIYGRLCVQLQRKRLLTPDTLRKYRSAWFFKQKDTYGEEQANAKEAEMMKRHKDAETLEDSVRSQVDTPIPKPKTQDRYDWDGQHD